MNRLPSSIVCVNQFSQSLGPGKGTRGHTPGNFILSYVMRASGGEYIAPAQLKENDDPALYHQAVEKSTRDAQSSKEILDIAYKKRQRGGIAFADGNPALSNERVLAMSKEIQRHFDQGGTVMMTVLSFDKKYLEDNGVLEPGFLNAGRRELMGHVDQLKLRMSIMHGLDRLKPDYGDLHYIGAVHVDTRQAHCHVVLTDYSKNGPKKGRDGRPRGMLYKRQIQNIRHGIDTYLDIHQNVKTFSSAASRDKQTVLGYVKRYTYGALAQRGFPQLLMACLPDNRNEWTANSNRKEMQKANALVREFVLEILQPKFGQTAEPYKKAHKSIVQYANARQRREGASEEDRLKWIRDGEKKLLTDCMNKVYSVFKEIPKEQMVQAERGMDLVAVDYDLLASQALVDPGAEFMLKTRSYFGRLKHHRDEYHKFREEYDAYQQTRDPAEGTDWLAAYLAYERQYQQMLMVKYQYMLDFLPMTDELQDEFDEVIQQQDVLLKMEQMERDSSLRRMGPDTASEYGYQVYGLAHGELVHGAPQVWQRRKQAEYDKYEQRVKEFKTHLADYGMSFDGQRINRQKPFEFDDVKMLDLHHLGYDFPYDVPVSKRNIDRFVEVANKRYELYQKAADYIRASHQAPLLDALDKRDIEHMKSFADHLGSGFVTVTSKRTGGGKTRTPRYTFPFGQDYTMKMEDAVRSAVEASRQFE